MSFLSSQPRYNATGRSESLGVARRVIYLQQTLGKIRNICGESYLVILLHRVPPNPLFVFFEKFGLKGLLANRT